MRRQLFRRVLLILLLLPLTGCGRSVPTEAPNGIVFERGHGSAWGNQFYIEICPERIIVARYIPEGSSELGIVEDIAITREQWQQVESQLASMTLEKEQVSLWKRLFGGRAQDGGEYRRLTLLYGDRELSCRWPADGEGLEALLEQLVREVAQ